MRKHLLIGLSSIKRDNIRNLDGWYKIKTSLNLFLALIIPFIFIHCSSKPMETKSVSQFFTINGTELNHDFNSIPDTMDKDVYQAEVNSSISFKGLSAIPSDEDQWILDGKVIEKGKDHFEYQFDMPGLYQIKHCHGLDTCVTRYIFVKEPAPVIKEKPIPEKEITINPPIKKTPIKPQVKEKKVPEKVQINPVVPVTPTEPQKQEVKPIVKPPETFKTMVTTGLSAVSFNEDCATWVETANIKLKPKEFCLLQSASIFGNGPGKVRVSISDGEGYNQSMIVLLTAGKTQFTFTELLPVLYPGKNYTLTFSTIVGDINTKPKIANISSCNATPKTTSDLQIEYGSSAILFELKYKI